MLGLPFSDRLSVFFSSGAAKYVIFFIINNSHHQNDVNEASKLGAYAVGDEYYYMGSRDLCTKLSH